MPAKVLYGNKRVYQGKGEQVAMIIPSLCHLLFCLGVEQNTSCLWDTHQLSYLHQSYSSSWSCKCNASNYICSCASSSFLVWLSRLQWHGSMETASQTGLPYSPGFLPDLFCFSTFQVVPRVFHSSNLALAFWITPKTTAEKAKERTGLYGHMDQLEEARDGDS